MTVPRKTPYLMHDAVPLTVDDTDYESEEIDCMQESEFLVKYVITETGALVANDRLRIQVQTREVGGAWTTLTGWAWGQLFVEESMTPLSESYGGKCRDEKIRLVVTTDYTNADPTSNYFTITTRLTLTTPT